VQEHRAPSGPTRTGGELRGFQREFLVAAVVRAQRVGVALRVPQRGRSRFLGRPASRSYSSTEQDPIIEEKACATGGPSHLLRVVSFDYLARVLRADAREGRYLSMPGTRVFRRAKACGVLGMGGAHIGRSAARSSCGLGRPESRRSGRSVESRRERSGRPSASGRVGEHRAGRQPTRQLRLWQPSRARSCALASVGRAAASRTIRTVLTR
jgi:hypothetical protein